MIAALVIAVLAYALGGWLFYTIGFDKGVKQATLPEVMDTRLEAARAEREVWDITRRAFEAMAERACRER